MRVAFVTELTAHHDGGECLRHDRLADLAARFAEAGHDVATFCARWWDGGGTVYPADGHDYRAVTPAPGEGFATRLPGALRRWGPDVVHAAHDDAATVLAADLGGAPLVVDWYDPVDRPEGGLRAAPAGGSDDGPRRHRTQW
ncbi:MAG: glycosyltransferase [Halobacteriaceae archaeon]